MHVGIAEWASDMDKIHSSMCAWASENAKPLKTHQNLKSKLKLQELSRSIRLHSLFDDHALVAKRAIRPYDFNAMGASMHPPQLNLHNPCLHQNKVCRYPMVYSFVCGLDVVRGIAQSVQGLLAKRTTSVHVYAFWEASHTMGYLYFNLSADFMRMCLFYTNFVAPVLPQFSGVTLNGNMYAKDSILSVPNSGKLHLAYNNGGELNKTVAVRNRIFQDVFYTPLTLLEGDTNLFCSERCKICPFVFCLQMNVYAQLDYSKLLKSYETWFKHLNNKLDKKETTSLRFLNSIEMIPAAESQNALTLCRTARDKFGINMELSKKALMIHMNSCVKQHLLPTFFRFKKQPKTLVLFKMLNRSRLKKLKIVLIKLDKPPPEWVPPSHDTILAPCFLERVSSDHMLMPQASVLPNNSFVQTQNKKKIDLSIMANAFIEFLMGHKIFEVSNLEVLVLNSCNRQANKRRRSDQADFTT